MTVLRSSSEYCEGWALHHVFGQQALALLLRDDLLVMLGRPQREEAQGADDGDHQQRYEHGPSVLVWEEPHVIHRDTEHNTDIHTELKLLFCNCITYLFLLFQLFQSSLSYFFLHL